MNIIPGQQCSAEDKIPADKLDNAVMVISSSLSCLIISYSLVNHRAPILGQALSLDKYWDSHGPAQGNY